jgi:L-asparagine transporter-like permease
MSKAYKIFSRAYRMMLGAFIIFFPARCFFFPGTTSEDLRSGIWLLLFSIVTFTAISIFHALKNDHRLKIYLHLITCVLVLTSLVFLVFLLFTGEDGNLLVHAVLFVMIFINAVLLLHLIRDKKYLLDKGKEQV